ncbi:thiamine-phosphate kinase [Bacillus sp. FJAT-47783]|uniref:thiamine-phosphate kinase n=1 Tax=Bacillus sp. FJAT-47783 TaxID=2922712 RepID=UPI001FAE2E66|nr:thiamine-phosphate kinase [Bacillus sp. FJAT-47783]
MSIKDEFQFIKRICPSHTYNRSLKVGIGDDAAVYEAENDYDQVVCMDSMVEGVHFTKNTMSPFDIGYKSLAVNLSDLAAMGAIPMYYLVSIAIPETWNEHELYAIYDGLNSIAKEYSADLIGGDTTSSKGGLVITVTVIGTVESGKALLRSSAKPGDIVFVTGTLGDSAAGLHLLLTESADRKNEDHVYLLVKHQRPIPRIQVGRQLVQYDRACLNDISDGLASELHEIADESNVSIQVRDVNIPLSSSIKIFPEEQQKKWALTGGEDFELVGTLSPHDFIHFKEACKQKGMKITKIGDVIARQENGVIYIQNGLERSLHKSGYNHFKKGDKMEQKFELISTSPEQTAKLAEKIAGLLQPSDVITLEGDLGAGKTTFTKALAKGLGIKRNVNSPTFTIIKEYTEGRLPLYHMDVYRMEDSEEDLGFDEYFEGEGVSVIEWAHLIEDQLPTSRLDISILHLENNKRKLILKPIGERYTDLCKELLNDDSFID